MKSPDGQFFVEVLVAGEPQREYLHNNRTYVVRTLAGSLSPLLRLFAFADY